MEAIAMQTVSHYALGNVQIDANVIMSSLLGCWTSLNSHPQRDACRAKILGIMLRLLSAEGDETGLSSLVPVIEQSQLWNSKVRSRTNFSSLRYSFLMRLHRQMTKGLT